MCELHTEQDIRCVDKDKGSSNLNIFQSLIVNQTSSFSIFFPKLRSFDDVGDRKLYYSNFTVDVHVKKRG